MSPLIEPECYSIEPELVAKLPQIYKPNVFRMEVSSYINNKQEFQYVYSIYEGKEMHRWNIITCIKNLTPEDRTYLALLGITVKAMGEGFIPIMKEVIKHGRHSVTLDRD